MYSQEQIDDAVRAGALSAGDAAALRDLIIEAAKAKKLKKKSPLLYLAGEELARDLAGELRDQGFEVVTHIAYRMVPAKSLPGEVVEPALHRPEPPPPCEDRGVGEDVIEVLHRRRRRGVVLVERLGPAGLDQPDAFPLGDHGEVGVFAAVPQVLLGEPADPLPA